MNRHWQTEIEGVPIAKQRHRTVRYKNGGVGTYDPQTQDKRNTRDFLRYMIEDPFGSSPVAVKLSFYMPVPKSTPKAKRRDMLDCKVSHDKKPDLDNLIKYILDCMNTVVFDDDSQIFLLGGIKLYDEHPRTVIQVWGD